MKLSEQLKSSWDIFDAIEAAKNWRALLLLIYGMIAASLLFYAGMSTENKIISWFSVLIAVAISLYSWNAVGIMLYDNAASGIKTNASDALLRSIFSGHRLVILIAISSCGYLVVMLLMALLLLLGRIPEVGAYFTFITVPASTVILGGFWFLCLYFLLPLASASIWSGDTLGRVLSNTFLLMRNRFMSVLVREVFLGLFVFLVGGLLAVCLSMGTLTTTRVGYSLVQRNTMHDLNKMEGPDFGDAAPMVPDMPFRRFGMIPGGGMVVGPEAPALRGTVPLLMGEILDAFGLPADSNAVRQVIAGGSGLLVILGIASFIPALIMAQGMCLIYLSSVKGLDLAEGEAALRENVASAKKRFAEARMAAERAAEEARNRNSGNPGGENPPASPRVCPNCHFGLEDDDVFCPNCGHKFG